MKFFIKLSCALIIGLVGFSACSGRNIHKDLKADTAILTRGWTMPTSGAYVTGDRGFEYSNPVIYQNTIIFGNRTQGITSLYPGLMKVRWTFPVVGGVVSAPLVEKNSVFFGGADGFLYCLNAETGKQIWKYEVKNSLISKPTFAGGRLFATTADDTVYAFDAGTGKWLWHYKRRSPQTATIHAVSTPLVDGANVLVGMSDGFIVSLSVEEGTLKWERQLNNPGKFIDVDAGPVLAGDVIFQPSYDGALYALKRKTGEVQWKFEAGGSKQIVADEASLYLPSNNGFIYSLNKSSGKLNWKFELDKGTPTQLAMTDQYVIFGSTHQYLYVLDRATGKGLYRWNAGDGSGFAGSPLYDAERKSVYILSMAGNLYQFNVRTGFKKPDVYQFNSAYR